MNGPESAQKRGLSEQGTQPIDELPVGDPDDRVDVPLGLWSSNNDSDRCSHGLKDTHVSTTGSPGTAPRVPEGDPVAPSSFLSQLGRGDLCYQPQSQPPLTFHTNSFSGEVRSYEGGCLPPPLAKWQGTCRASARQSWHRVPEGLSTDNRYSPLPLIFLQLAQTTA